MNLRPLKAAVTRLVKAEINNAFKGAGHPDDYSAIERELEMAKANYKRQCDIVQCYLGVGSISTRLRGLQKVK